MAFLKTDLHRSLAENIAELLLHFQPHEIAAIASSAQPCAVTGRVTSDSIMIAMGECCDVWPDTVLPDVCDTAKIIQFPAAHRCR